MNRYELGLLISLDMLLEERNVTRAAVRLHITQSALSTQLARLRVVFGDVLLAPSPSGRGMTLTPRAEELQQTLHTLLRHMNELADQGKVFNPSEAKRDFVLAVNDNVATMIGIDLVQRFRQASGPGVRLALRQVDIATLPALMLRGEVDLVINTQLGIPVGLSQLPVLRDSFRIAQRKGHPRGQMRLTVSEYCKLEHVIVSTSGSFIGPIDAELRKLRKQRHVALSVQHYSLVPLILERTDYVATLPSKFLERHGRRLDTFTLPVAQREFLLFAGWHPRVEADPGHRWLREQILSLTKNS